MAREIKFRAWDTEKKEMAEVSSMSFDCDEIHLMDKECRVWNTVKDYIAIPMQYTGLRDKNGKEVYEGDIFKYTTSTVDGNQICGKACIDSIFNYELMRNMDTSNSLEIIGNIYENPELLK